MTISSTTRRTETVGDGSTTAFAFGYPYRVSSDLKVYLRDNTSLVATLQTITTHYTVSGVANAGNGGFNSASITFGVAPTSSQTVVILRDVPPTQTTFDATDNAALGASAIEGAFDKLALQIQDQALGLLKGSATIDFASVAAGAISSASNVTVTGAKVGDHVLSVTASGDIATTDGVFLVGKVTAADTVEVTLCNDSASSFDAASQSVFVVVLPKANLGQ